MSLTSQSETHFRRLWRVDVHRAIKPNKTRDTPVRLQPVTVHDDAIHCIVLMS